MSTGRIKGARSASNASSLPEIGKINLNELHEVERYPMYMVSKSGKVYSKKLKKLLRQDVCSGYNRVCLYNSEGAKKTLVHRLVAITFIPNPKNKKEVNHIDGNKINNSVGNLEWNTTAQNHKHAEVTGLKAKGNTHGMSKLTDEQRREIVEKYIPWIRKTLLKC